jgi:integrase/recombinase XerC
MMNGNDALVGAWLDWLASGNLSPNTIRNRRYTIGTFAAHVDLMTASSDDILAHLDGLTGGPWSRSGHLAAIRSLYFWMHGMGHREDNPAGMIRSVKVHERTRPALPKGTLDRAILLADDRTRLALLLGSRAGLRREEIATFHSSCIRGDSLVIVGKGSKERRIPMHPQLRPYCDELRTHPGWAFPSHVLPGRHVTPETIQRLVTKALGEPWRTHDLRRFAATSWYNATLDLRTVQLLLGHADPMTTARYVHANDDSMTRAVLAVA